MTNQEGRQIPIKWLILTYCRSLTYSTNVPLCLHCLQMPIEKSQYSGHVLLLYNIMHINILLYYLYLKLNINFRVSIPTLSLLYSSVILYICIRHPDILFVCWVHTIRHSIGSNEIMHIIYIHTKGVVIVIIEFNFLSKILKSIYPCTFLGVQYSIFHRL